MKRFFALLLVLSVSVSACGDDPPPATSAPAKKAAPSKKTGRAAKAGEQPQAEAEVQLPPAVQFSEADFSENERSRDPFRSFVEVFAAQSKIKVNSQLNVVAKQYTIEELKLVAIVTRIEPARAMFVDPSGKGHVVDHGDFIGKAEIIQSGSGSADYEIYWRVDRVRDTDVVLVREDPANPDIATATRVIPLRIEDTLNESL